MVVHVVLSLGAGDLQGGSPVMGIRGDSPEASVMAVGCGMVSWADRRIWHGLW